MCYLSVSKDSRKRKKFPGISCTKAKAILAYLTTVSLSVSLEDVAKLSDHNAILCNGCERLLDTISKLEVKLQTLQSEVVEMLQGLPLALVQRWMSRKRLSSTFSEGTQTINTS